MASCQMQKEKADFFAHLEKLCEFDSEDSSLNDEDVKIIEGIPKTDNTTAPIQKKSSVQSGSNVFLKHNISPHGSKRRTQIAGPPDTIAAGQLRTVKAVDKDNTSKHVTRSDVDVLPITPRGCLFEGLTFYFIPNNDVARPRRARIAAAVERGAVWTRIFDSKVTHVIADYNIDFTSAAKAFQDSRVPDEVIVVRDTWLIESITSKHIQDPSQSRFMLKGTPKDRLQPKKSTNSICRNTAKHKRKHDEMERRNLPDVTLNCDNELEQILQEVKNLEQMKPSDFDSSEDRSFPITSSETSAADEYLGPLASRSRSSCHSGKGFQCMERNNGEDAANPNLKTIDILQKMAAYYDRTGDHWRTTAYRKAIGALRKQKTLISTQVEARAIPQIGRSLAEKIEEIVRTNKLKRLESTMDNEEDRILQTFMGIYGVGLAQAMKWIAQGHHSLDDLMQKAKLSPNQKVGIEHYDDFQQRITREEVAKHAHIVQTALHKIDPDLDAIIGGSYRRGSADSGDIDIIITKRDASMEVVRTLVMDSAVPSLEMNGFFKVALASSHRHKTGSKWHGASCLPGHTTWRRIDLLIVPWAELGAALIYFTGNDIFNRSMRLLASRKGMRLNQHGLYADVMRGRASSKITDGQLLEGHSEKRIFDLLGVPWRPPEHRKC